MKKMNYALRIMILIFAQTFLIYCFVMISLSSKFDAVLTNNEKHLNIAIVIVLEATTKTSNYEIAIETVECYARIHNYTFLMVNESDYHCPQPDKFFRRHCVVSHILPTYDAVMFLDADIGVVNPKRRIEDYMDENVDIIFYDRFYNWEIALGSYIVRNSMFSFDLLNNFADYVYKLPKSFHGTDNGALHLFLAQRIFPNSPISLQNCETMWNKSESYADLFTYEACIRTILGESTDFGKIRIMKKGTAWVRDGWIDGGKWSAGLDFMLHGWKMKELVETPENVTTVEMSRTQWYNPLAGRIALEKCSASNSTWNYDKRLIATSKEILENHRLYEKDVAVRWMEALSGMGQLVNRYWESRVTTFQ